MKSAAADYLAPCHYHPDDQIGVRATGLDGDVRIESYHDGQFQVSAYLTPKKARKLAKAIKKAAKAAEKERTP